MTQRKPKSADRREYQIGIQLVPAPLWGKNMRALLTQSQWRSFRNEILKRQGMFCATCGKTAEKSSQLNAHEEWRYDETVLPATATITNVSLLCWHCHHIEHFGLVRSLVNSGQLTIQAIDDTISHFCRLNGATKKDFSVHEIEANEVWVRRNGLEWRIEYGPFLDWVVAAYAHDPLNGTNWPTDLQAKSGRKNPPDIEWTVHKLDIAKRPRLAA